MYAQIVKLIACLRSAAPYLAIELILPGGSLIALVIWLLRNRTSVRFGLRHQAPIAQPQLYVEARTL